MLDALKKKLRAGWYWVCRWACRLFCILFFRFRAYGRENIPDKGGFVLVSNHQSYLDPVLCGVALKRQLCFLARETLFGNWFFRWLTFSLNAIPVKRGRGNLSAVKKVISKLKEGMGVCLYPEGTRTNDGKIASFKGGFSLLCRRGDAVVVPMVVDGAFECWPRHKKIFSSGQVTISYGKAIAKEQVENMSDKEFADALADTMRRMQNECRIRQGKKPYDYGR